MNEMSWNARTHARGRGVMFLDETALEANERKATACTHGRSARTHLGPLPRLAQVLWGGGYRKPNLPRRCSLSPVYLVCEWLDLRVMRVKSVCLVAAAVGPFEPGTWVFFLPL